MSKLLNSWEGRGKGFLSNSFNQDAHDIASYLKDHNITNVCEIGFGNNRLLKTIIDSGVRIGKFLGLDKTWTFVRRAMMSYPGDGFEFKLVSLEQALTLLDTLHTAKPEILIIRYVLEHVPLYRDALLTINTSNVPRLIICVYTEDSATPKSSIIEGTSVDYTLNTIPTNEITKVLSNYHLIRKLTYKPLAQRVLFFELRGINPQSSDHGASADG